MRFVPKRLVETGDISRAREPRSHLLRTAAWVVAGCLGAYLVVGILADVVAMSIGESAEAAFFAFSASVGQERPDAPGFQRAREVFERLQARPELRPLPYRLVLLDMAEPNAIALPGGLVGVTRGLLERLEGEVGLAAVLGHELGHHQARHVLKRMGRTILWRLALSLLGGGSTEVVSAALALADSSYSRDQEREADEIGLRLVHEVYGTTAGALEFFEKMEREQGEAAAWTALVRSHPPTRERIEALRRIALELERGR